MRVGIIGISGAVGSTLLRLFDRHASPDIVELNLYGSERSAGTFLPYKEGVLEVQEFDRATVAGSDLLFLCVSGDFAKSHARELVRQGSIVIDNSSALRYEEDVPLLIPSINAAHYCGQNLLANPNCSSAIALMALAPLERHFGLEHVQLATYQAASGAGAPAMAELQAKTRAFENYERDDRSEYFYYNLAYNVVPQIDDFWDNGYTKEEMKAVWELRKVLERRELAVSATCVRVPTLRSHAEVIAVKLQCDVELEEVRQVWEGSPGLQLIDHRDRYPMPLSSSGHYAVEVGRLRHSLIHGKSGLEFFVSGDQLLRGAALNAYEIFCLTQGLPFPQEAAQEVFQEPLQVSSQGART